jgi:hypothetical protein
MANPESSSNEAAKEERSMEEVERMIKDKSPVSIKRNDGSWETGKVLLKVDKNRVLVMWPEKQTEDWKQKKVSIAEFLEWQKIHPPEESTNGSLAKHKSQEVLRTDESVGIFRRLLRKFL